MGSGAIQLWCITSVCLLSCREEPRPLRSASDILGDRYAQITKLDKAKAKPEADKSAFNPRTGRDQEGSRPTSEVGKVAGVGDEVLRKSRRAKGRIKNGQKARDGQLKARLELGGPELIDRTAEKKAARRKRMAREVRSKSTLKFITAGEDGTGGPLAELTNNATDVKIADAFAGTDGVLVADQEEMERDSRRSPARPENQGLVGSTEEGKRGGADKDKAEEASKVDVASNTTPATLLDLKSAPPPADTGWRALHNTPADDHDPGLGFARQKRPPFSQAVMHRDRPRSVAQRLASGPPLFTHNGPPAQVLPRVGYFENTYRGGHAAFTARLRHLNQRFEAAEPRHDGQWPHELASLPPQGFDPPQEAGLRLTADLHTSHLAGPGRIYLQVGLKGSPRYGWRRPPLDLVAILDNPMGHDPELARRMIKRLQARLGPTDRLAVLLVHGEAVIQVTPLKALKHHRVTTMSALKAALAQGAAADHQAGVERAFTQAGAMLKQASTAQARVPGSQTVLWLTCPTRVEAAKQAAEAAAAGAHALTLQGAVTSVLEQTDGDPVGQGDWWSVAQAGHGNHHVFHRGSPEVALEAELASLSRVVARLLRLNIKLGKQAHGIRVLGSQMLDEAETRRVKAREEATDRQISETLGVKADRGEDGDGLQTVIPFFYGGDDHIFLVELWVEGPGAIADISLKYKDMVNLTNATAQTSVHVQATPARMTPAHIAVRRNVRAFQVAEKLAEASELLSRFGRGPALSTLAEARALAVHADDDRLIEAFESAIDRHNPPMVTAALALASERRQGLSALR